VKQEIFCSKTFDLELAFNCIDDWKYGYIDKKNLKSFFRKHLYLTSTRESIAIIRRMDLDGDSRLTLKEFTDGLRPCEPYSKLLKRN
jgi:Ca2+-binding EF-hand superfamily protein